MRKFIVGTLYLFLLIVLILAGAFVWSANRTPARREARAFSEPAPRRDMGKALVVYFSLSGSTAEVAARVGEMTGGTLFEIETDKVYSALPMLYYTAWREIRRGDFPELKKNVGDFSSYDVVFVGAPVWWFSVPGPMRAFLAESDFGGKTVVPFCTQGGNSGDFFDVFAAAARNARVVEGKAFSKVPATDVAALDGQIASWLGGVAEELKREREANAAVEDSQAELDRTAPWRTASLDGTEIRYRDSGVKDAVPLVFIHGWSCDASFWRFQIPFFAGDYRVIVPDLPGFGSSGKPQDKDYSLGYLARAVRAVTEAAGAERPVLIGHSLGYSVARQYLIDYPGTVRAVVNVDGAFHRIPEDPQALAEWKEQTGGMLALFENDREKAVREFIENTFYEKTPAELRKEISGVMSAADPYASVSALREMMRPEQWETRSFDVPALAVYAAAEYLPPDHEAYLKTVFPRLTYLEWDGVGHYMMLERPEEFNRTLRDFLGTLSR